MQASVVSSFSASAIAIDPSHGDDGWVSEIEIFDYADSESVETLHKMPVQQLYLNELEFRLAMSNYICTEEIPVAESNHLVMQTITRPSQSPSANAFACSTLLYPIVIDDHFWSAKSFDAESDCEQIQRADKQPEYCQKLRQLFRDVDNSRKPTPAKPLSAFQRLVRAVDWNNAEKTEVLTFKQWFLAASLRAWDACNRTEEPLMRRVETKN